MPEELRLKTHHTPSMFNKDMVLGALIGTLIPGGIVIDMAAIAIGGVIGGMMGKGKQERENHEGKVVGEPSALNKDMVIGGLIGLNLGAFAAGLAGIGVLGAGVALSGGTALAGSALAAGAAVIATWVGSTALGAYIGGQRGKSQQAQELDQAKAQYAAEHLAKNASPEVKRALSYTLEKNIQMVPGQWAQDVSQPDASQGRTR